MSNVSFKRVKEFRVLTNEIPLSFHGSVNQIWTVCCMLCNFMTPSIPKDMESGWYNLDNVGPYTELVCLIIHFSISEKLYLAENTVFLKTSPLPRQKNNRKKQSPEMSVKNVFLKIPLNSQENTRDSLFFNKVVGCTPATLLKETPAEAFSCTGVFLKILRNFQGHLKWVTSWDNCFWTD